ncbi:MAG: glycoside hydrolase family 97 protein [Paludibacteraceae bacterium]|nr:glycoside hydrolase family 97 protein [Paludibacteraceae bacterium]
MKHVLPILVAACLLAACTRPAAVLRSPDGQITLTATVDADGTASYSAAYRGETVILPSHLGFLLQDGTDLSRFRLAGFSRDSHDDTWEQPWGERRLVRNHYNELTMHLTPTNSPTEGEPCRVNIVFRAFDDGIAFRYEVSNSLPYGEERGGVVITDELTEFRLPWNAEAWSGPTNHTNFLEALWTKSPLSEKDTVATPLTIEVRDDLYMAIHEANLTDYASLDIAPLKPDFAAAEPSSAVTLKAALVPWSDGTLVKTRLPFVSPWRTLLIADKPGDLITSYMELNLNEPCRINNTAWIEPGRYIGIWWGMHMKDYTWEIGPKHGATTANTMRYIDFAAAHGFKGVLVEGWNKGWEGDWTRIDDHFKYTEAYPDYDIDSLCRYARERGVRIIAHTETGGAVENFEQQMDSAFAFYHRLGINAVKTGYVNPKHDGREWQRSQYGVEHYRRVVETAARYEIMIDNHEPAMPTGLRRTWPNLMTGEGVRGQEWNAWNASGGNPPYHTCVLPFTRGLAGPMDFTPVIFNFTNKVLPDVHPESTIAKQLAEFLILYSPLQMAADMIENMEGQPGLSFVESCPTTWEETRVLSAKIGEYILEARKVRDDWQPQGSEPGPGSWFVAGITNEEARKFTLPLDFLDDDATYTATIYSDGTGADYQANPYPLDITTRTVNSRSFLDLHLARSGGVAIRIAKQ